MAQVRDTAVAVSYASGPDVVDEHRFVDRDGLLVFVSTHRPRAAPRRRVLFVSPVGVPFDHNVRTEVLLARALAATGSVCRRFHYSGAGESDGAVAEIDAASLVTDARWALRDFDDHAALPLTLVATHWGAAVALAMCTDAPSAQLVLVDPVTSPRRFVREIAFARRAAAGEHDDDRPLAEVLASDGVADVGGTVVHRRLHDSVASMAEEWIPDVGERRVLVVGQAVRGKLPAPHRHLADRLRAGGATVDDHVVDGDLQWWIAHSVERPEEDKALPSALLRVVPRWVEGTGSHR